MGPRIMVTGASGTLGQEIVKSLHNAGANVIAASRSLKRLPNGIRGLQLDYDNVSLLTAAFKGIDVLLISQPLSSVMLSQAENIVKAARSAGVQFILRVSGMGADEKSPYLFQRIQGEVDSLVSESGIPFALLKPNIFMQCFVSSFGDAIRQGVLFLPQGEGRTSFVDARDTAAVAAEILQSPWRHEHRVFDLTGGRAISNAEAISLISNQVERQLAYVPITEEAAVKNMLKSVTEPWLIDVTMSIHRATRDGAVEQVSQTLKNTFGREPVKFEDFCSENKERWVKPSVSSLEVGI